MREAAAGATRFAEGDLSTRLHEGGPGEVGELTRALRGVSARTLTKQLRELEADGIISRKVYQQIPPMVEYSVTPKGKELQPVLVAMHAWGERHG